MSDPILPPRDQWAALTPTRDSVTWRAANDSRLILAAVPVLLLQISHPTIGAGVHDYSDYQSGPWGRLLRTLDFTMVMIYGGPEAAGEMCRRLRSYHKPIKGTLPDGRRYHALEPDTYAWVHATLAEGIVTANARFGGPIPQHKRQQFWDEWRALGRLLGVRERDLPASWQDFRPYVDDMIANRLQRTAAVDEFLRVLSDPAPPRLTGLQARAWPLFGVPFIHALRLGFGLVPPILRERLDLPWTWRNELELRTVAVGMRAVTPVLPPLRNGGPLYLRVRQDAIARGDVASTPPSTAATARAG